MTIKPLLDRVVLKVEEAEEKTKSGIILSSACICCCSRSGWGCRRQRSKNVSECRRQSNCK